MDGKLLHYGIKGMKWGVRRFRDKNGDLTSAGKKRYSESDGQPKKSKHRQKLEDAYVKNGLTKKQAEELADKRIRTEKIVAAAAGITVAACAAYVANKQIRKRIDGVIKEGSALQRIEMQDTNGKLHDVFYAAQGRRDSKRYKNLLGMQRQQQTGQAYIMKLKTGSDVRVASQKRARDTFKELYESDSEFRSKLSTFVSVNGKSKLSNREATKYYEQFNQALVNPSIRDSKIDQKFYGRLKSAGYGAIQDINDMKFSGYNAKNPLIVFDNSKNSIFVESVRKIEEDLTMKGSMELAKAMVEGSAERHIPHAVIGSTGVAAVTYLSNPNDDVDAYKYRRY